jgi:hypothetical protein
MIAGMRATTFFVVGGPRALAGYGAARWWGRSDGVYGPGFDWQLAHGLALLGIVLFVPAVIALGRLLPRGPVRTGLLVITLLGAAATAVQFGADIVEGLMATSHAGMSALSRDFRAVPGVVPVVYTVGPQLFFVGLVAIGIALAVRRRVPWWSPAVLLTSALLPLLTLDLLPLAALGMLAALAPALRPMTRTGPQSTVAGGLS